MEADFLMGEEKALHSLMMNHRTPFTNEEHMEQRTQRETDKSYLEDLVTFIRLHLYNRGVPCGAQVIQRQIQELNIKPIPSVRTIGRILSRHGLTHGRTGIYPEDYICETENQDHIQDNNHTQTTKKEA
jgi:hypothetical protein